MLNHLLLIACLCISISLFLYAFFWNRFIGFLLSYTIRFLYWNQDSSSIWVDIGSIHFSLLAGRILLKDVRYHSSNQTIKVVKGQISWRYWIRRPATEEALGHSHGRGEDERSGSHSSPCRVQFSFQGFEWFLYNRTPAFDNIISQMEASNNPGGARSQESGQPFQKYSHPTASALNTPSLLVGSIQAPATLTRAIAWFRRQLPNFDPKDLLPLGIEITKGAIVCGNASTPNILVAEFQRTDGTFGVVQSRSQYDLYKQILRLRFQNASARYIENEDYWDSMIATGELVDRHFNKIPHSDYLVNTTYQRFAKLWRHLKLFSLIFRKPGPDNEFNRKPHIGSRRQTEKSLDEDMSHGVDYTTLEYAIERKILEAPVLELSYYADIVGDVPAHQPRINSEPIDIGNGDIAPEWGVDIILWGGFLRYGPWADRQRAELQRAFFPPTYHDLELTPFLKPGDKRMWTSMQIFIELRDNTTLRIPFREASKNWQWDGKSQLQRPRKREPASIHITAGDMSSLSYSMPMITGPVGYEPLLEVHLDSIEITSSLNDIRLITAESCRVRCDLPSPIKWNIERKWTFAVFLRQPVLYLIRDHINMVTDLTKDWTSGPASDYRHFIPIVYAIELEMYHYELNTYVNDHNIIDKPLIKDENALLTIRGKRFDVQVDIPSLSFRPESSTLSFHVDAPEVALTVSLPRWNTHALYVPLEGNSIGSARNFCIDGSYLFFNDVREEHVEQLKLTFTACDVAFKALGWSIRYFMVMRDNYFGSFTHFSTLYEYLDRRRMGLPVGDPVVLRYREGKSNVLQVEMGVIANNMLVVLPAGIPGYETSSLTQREKIAVSIGASVILTVPELHLQFRMHDYYMEMTLNMDSISGRVEKNWPEIVTYEKSHAKDTLLIDGIDIIANRLFGPQPRTATYVCLWEIHIGQVKVISSVFDSRIAFAAINAFRLNFSDSSNAPAAEYAPPVDPDVTFLKISLDGLDITWQANNAAVVVSIPQGLTIENNDLTGKLYRKVTGLRVPHVCVKVLLTSTPRRSSWLEAAELTADAYMDIYSSPLGWQDSARRQANFVNVQDLPTGRAKQMFSTLNSSTNVPSRPNLHKNNLYLPRPTLRKRRRTETLPTMHSNHTSYQEKSHQYQHSSESDEEIDSKTRRDAELARARFDTPVASWFAEDDDQDMSSGDESDDEDLTDADSSDSDWSDYEAGSNNSVKSLLMLYSRLTRHFTSRHLDTPSLWRGSPFVQTRDPYSTAFIAAHPSSQQIFETERKAAMCVNLENPNNNTDSTVFRFQCREGLKFEMTPLILPVVAQVLEELKSNGVGPELCIDSMMTTCLSRMIDSIAYMRSDMVDIQLSSAHLRILQHINTKVNSSADTQNLHFDGPIALVDITLDKCHVIGNRTTQDYSSIKQNYTAAFRELSVTLHTTADKRSVERTPKPAVGLWLLGFTGGLVDQKLDVIWDTMIIDMDQTGPESMAAMAVALGQTVEGIKNVHSQWNRHNIAIIQSVIYGILQSSGDMAIIDPLSTIQPSYLVQSGRPQELRTDATFKFLYHMRYCLWDLDVERRKLFGSLAPIVGPVSKQEMVLLLESRVNSLALDADASNILELTSLMSPVPKLKVSKSQSRDFKSLSLVSIRIQTISITVLNPLAAPSQITITSLFMSARVRAVDFIQSVTQPRSFSQTSFRDPSKNSVRRSTVSISGGDFRLTVYPHLMYFAQQVLRVHKLYGGFFLPVQDAAIPPGVHSSEDGGNIVSVEVVISLRRIRIQAAAENLAIEFGATGIQVASSTQSRRQHVKDHASNHSLIFEDLFLRARSPTKISRQSEQDILAAIMFCGGKANIVTRDEPSSNMVVRMIFVVDSLDFNVPRSALRLYRFVEEWRADFLPGIEATVHALVSELQTISPKTFSPTSSRPKQEYPVMQIHGHVRRINVSLQVMHGTWLSWEVKHTVVYLKSSKASTHNSIQEFGLQTTSQTYSISSKHNPSQDAALNTRVKLALPKLSLTGHINGSRIHTLVLIEFFHLKVKPSHWDTLLAVQQKFGQDFNDLVTLVQNTRLQRPLPNTTETPSSLSNWKYVGILKMKGFRVGLEGLSSTVFLECEDIGGGINNDAGRTWNLKLSDLALSLAPAAVDTQRSAFNRNHRSAFVIINFEAGGKGGLLDHSSMLHVTASKIHAVMQPSSIGQVGDFIDHLQAEMLERKEQRALELAAFKEKTKSVLRTFEVKVDDAGLRANSAWFSEYTVDVSIENIGIAFPLTLDQDLELPQTGSRDSSAVRAFIFSIKSLGFGTQRGEIGSAVMNGFSFQFVPRFRQSVSTDFIGENHQTRNRLLYPQMNAQIRSDRAAASRHIWINANVSGFILDLDSTIPDYIFSLVDVYRQGKERIARLTASAPAGSINVQGAAPSLEKQYTALPTSNVLASLTFLSGRVRVYSGSLSVSHKARPLSTREAQDEPLEPEAEIFNLPVVSVWAEYRATPAFQKVGPVREVEPSILMFKSTVHSSENTLRPTLLPFVTELGNHVEARMRKDTWLTSNSSSPSPVYPLPSAAATKSDSVFNMQISFSLRIDQSKLELTCQPDVNVIAGLHWDSGGFCVNLSPGARTVTFTGTVGGLNAGLKHGFLSEDCVRLDARNLTFSMTFAKMAFDPGLSVNSISVVLDTEFSGVARFSRLQDVLCFKAVWLDRIPIFIGQNGDATRLSSKSNPQPAVSSLPRQEFTTAVLIRIRQIKLDVDLGQSISAITFDLKEAIMRTKLTEGTNEVSLSIADVAITAKGNVSGQGNVPNCVFQTIRRSEGASIDDTGKSKMLELNMTSGPLVVMLESDHQQLFHYRAEPIKVEVFDDWSMISSQGQDEKPLCLSFVVSGSAIVAVVTVGTIPKLLSYTNKFKANLNAQREGASRESKAFRGTRSPQPDNPLSTVAHAMLHSARSRFHEAETGLSYVIRQSMTLQLHILHLVVFPRTMDDAEMAQFIGRDVHARLDRTIDSGTLPAKRDLHLSFSSMAISKFGQLNHTLATKTGPADGNTWLKALLKDAVEAIIVGLPSMDMHMFSEEMEGPPKTVVYDFNSQFVRREGMKDFEDIYITLNVSLYSWLTLLRKNLSREMDQVRATADWQVASTAVSPPTAASTRRKPPEPLLLVDGSRFTTPPRSFTPVEASASARTPPAFSELKSASLPYFTTTPRELTLESSAPKVDLPENPLSPYGEKSTSNDATPITSLSSHKKTGIIYQHRARHIERLTMRQLGEATPDVMHPFFMKKAGFNLEDSLPQYVNEYATLPLEEIMEVLLKVYSQQLLVDRKNASDDNYV